MTVGYNSMCCRCGLGGEEVVVGIRLGVMGGARSGSWIYSECNVLASSEGRTCVVLGEFLANRAQRITICMEWGLR